MARNPNGNVLVKSDRIPMRNVRRKSSSKPLPNAPYVKSENRRELIVAIATRLFCDNGFHATTVRQIADKVGMLSGSIYHHFDSKEDIFEEIIRNYVSEKRKAVTLASSQSAGFLNAVSGMCTVHIIHVISNSTISMIMSNEARMIERLPRYRFVVESEAEVADAWRGVLHAAVRAGKLHPDIDCGLTIGSIMTLINNVLSYIGKSDEIDGFPPPGNMDHVIDQILAIVFGIISPWMKK